MVSSHCKETGLVINLAILVKVANLNYSILTAFNKYWTDIAAKFIHKWDPGDIYLNQKAKISTCKF